MNTINNQEQQEVDVNDDSWGEEDIEVVSDELLLAYYKVVFKGKDIVMANNTGFPAATGAQSVIP